MGTPEHILVIEDSDGDALLVEDALRQPPNAPIRVSRARRLAEGIDVALTTCPDLVLLDLGLPDSIGLMTVRTAVQRISAIPIVVLTGSDDEGLADHAVQLGAQDYVVKRYLQADTLARVMRYAIERHRVTQQLRASNDELEQAGRFKDEFIAMASHELRTPVTVISGAIQTLLDHADDLDPADSRNFMLALRKQADRLVALVEDLLVLSRLERGNIECRPRLVELRHVATKAIEESLLNPSDTTVDVPEVSITTDPDHLERILTNLLDNAAKYGAPPVEISGSMDDDGLELSICDHGPGVDQDFLPHLFDKFTRSDKPEVHRAPGSGLGLAIVRTMCTTLGGSIEYRDTGGGGATFVVRLPRDVKESS